MPTRPRASRASAVAPKLAVHCSMPVRRITAITMIAFGATSSAILVGVMGERPFPDGEQPGALISIGLDPARAVNQQAQ